MRFLVFISYEDVDLNTLTTKPALGSANRKVYIMNMQYFVLSVYKCVCECLCVCVCVSSQAKNSFPPLMITGTIDCNADEQTRSARGVEKESGHV